MSEEMTPKLQFDEILSIIDSARNRALKAVNAELIHMYWDIGAYLSKLCADSSFGDKVIDEVAAYIADRDPEVKGFTRRGLYRMRQFYETYKDDEFVSPLVTQISWTNHLQIMSNVWFKDGGRATFLYGIVCERAVFQARVRAPDGERLL